MNKISFLLLVVSSSIFANPLPTRELTPGFANPDVTQDTINQTICKSGWTKTVRPSSSYTNGLKLKQMREQNLSGTPADYEEDHLISIELGGHPRNPKNLWPQLWDGEWGARKKDTIETRLKRMVCTGKISLADAQNEIAVDWVEAYKKYIPQKK